MMPGDSRQRGSALLELTVAAMLALLLVVWASHSLQQRLSEAAVQGHAAWMMTLRGALHGWLSRYELQVAQAASASALAGQGYADWTQPALAELKADGLLDPGFTETGLPGGVAVRVHRHGACPSADCRADILVHSLAPYVTPEGSPDDARTAQWLLATEGWGAIVGSLSGDRLRGPSVNYSNPPWAGPALAPGTVALVLTSDQLATRDFLRLNDSRDPDFQGDATIAGTIEAGEDLNVHGYFRLQRQESAGLACAVDGAMARQAGGRPLVCLDGRWQVVGKAELGGYSTNQMWGCANNSGVPTANPATGDCSCPLGSATVQVSDSGPQDFPSGRTLGYLCVE